MKLAAPHRRLFHLCAGSVFPTLLLFFPKWPVLAGAGGALAASLLIEVARRKHVGLNRLLMARLRLLLKDKEVRDVLGSTHLLIATVVAIAAFPPPIAALALFFAAIGDPAAALVGERFGRHRLLGKSLEGSAAFLAAALAIGGLLVAARLDTAVPVTLAGAIAATVLEVLPLGPDDNLKVPLGSGAVMLAASRVWG